MDQETYLILLGALQCEVTLRTNDGNMTRQTALRSGLVSAVNRAIAQLPNITDPHAAQYWNILLLILGQTIPAS